MLYYVILFSAGLLLVVVALSTGVCKYIIYWNIKQIFQLRSGTKLSQFLGVSLPTLPGA